MRKPVLLEAVEAFCMRETCSTLRRARLGDNLFFLRRVRRFFSASLFVNCVPSRVQMSPPLPHHATFENIYFTEICSGSEAGSYLRLIDFVYHSTLGLRVVKKRRSTTRRQAAPRIDLSFYYSWYKVDGIRPRSGTHQ